jgi:hypothetical protein
METKLETAGRNSGSNEMPGVESVTARFILAAMLHKTTNVSAFAQRNINTASQRERHQGKLWGTCHRNHLKKWKRAGWRRSCSSWLLRCPAT